MKILVSGIAGKQGEELERVMLPQALCLKRRAQKEVITRVRAISVVKTTRMVFHVIHPARKRSLLGCGFENVYMSIYFPNRSISPSVCTYWDASVMLWLLFCLRMLICFGLIVVYR